MPPAHAKDQLVVCNYKGVEFLGRGYVASVVGRQPCYCPTSDGAGLRLNDIKPELLQPVGQPPQLLSIPLPAPCSGIDDLQKKKAWSRYQQLPRTVRVPQRLSARAVLRPEPLRQDRGIEDEPRQRLSRISRMMLVESRLST